MAGAGLDRGGFWAGLLGDWRPNYPCQPAAMFLSYAVLHADWRHLLGNMLVLMLLAPAVTARAGQRGFLAIWLAATVGGGAGFALLGTSPRPMVGASGALFGLAGALLLWEAMRRRAAARPVWPVWRDVAGLALLNLVFWIALDGMLAWEAHLGGFLAGAAAGAVLHRRAGKAPSPADRGAALIGPGKTARQQGLLGVEEVGANMTERPRRVLAVASAGGHWVQLCRLTPAWDGCAVTYLTTDPGLRDGAEALATARGQPRPHFRTVTEANRWQKLRLIRSLAGVALTVLRTRPDVVITTGAAPGYFALRLGRMLGARTVWVDSIANAEELSLAGQKAGRHADLWLTQWPHLAGPGGPDHRGAVL